MKVAIIGSGDAGKELAASAARAGHHVKHSTHSHKEAVKDSDLVVLAVPEDKVNEVLDELSNDLDGKVIINIVGHSDAKNHGHVQFRPPRGG